MFNRRVRSGAHHTGKPPASAAASPPVPAAVPVPAATRLLAGGLPAGQQVSPEWVVAAARRAVAAIAPRELAVFATMANVWLAEDSGPRCGRPAPGGAPGPGYRINTVLFTELVFPVISGALAEILGNDAWEHIRGQPARRQRAAGADSQPPGAAAAVAMTIEQADALHDACERHARAAGLPSVTAAQLAAAVHSGPGPA